MKVGETVEIEAEFEDPDPVDLDALWEKWGRHPKTTGIRQGNFAPVCCQSTQMLSFMVAV